VNKSIANRQVTAVYEIEHEVHGVIANVFPRVVGRSPSESQLEIGSEPWRSAGNNRPWLVAFFISPLVRRVAFNPQTAATGALSQAQDDIRLMLSDGVDELALVKSHREDDLFEAGSPGKLPEDLLGDVIFKLAIRAKAVDKQTHPSSNDQDQNLSSLTQFRQPVILRFVTPIGLASLLYGIIHDFVTELGRTDGTIVPRIFLRI
jgi:hypothetical protein